VAFLLAGLSLNRVNFLADTTAFLEA